MHPMDLIKTRFQLQSNEMWCTNPKMQYTGIGDCMRKVFLIAKTVVTIFLILFILDSFN